MNKVLLTIEDVAAITGLANNQIVDLEKNGKFPKSVQVTVTKHLWEDEAIRKHIKASLNFPHPVCYDTISIKENCHCGCCGWPVIHSCCNGAMMNMDRYSDWWVYCSNKECVMHDGEDDGQGSHTDKWIVYYDGPETAA